MTRRDWLYLLAITLLAGALRFYQLGVVPPGPQFDEAFNAIDAGQVLAGNRPLFLPANGGREVLYTYYQAAIGALTGRLDLYTLRLASALAGTLTVAAVYMLVRTLFRRHSQTLAVLTALALAVNYWHIHFSHYGIRIILMPLILSGVFGCFWAGCELLARGRGGDKETRRQGEGETPRLHNSQFTIDNSQLNIQPPRPSLLASLFAFIASGVLTGLGVWNNPTGRFVPFVLLAYVIWLLWRYPERRRWHVTNPLLGLAVAGLVAFIVFLPLGLEFLRHPEFFFGHASEVSIFAERVAGEASPWQLLATNILRVLGMFSFDGDLEWAHGIPDRPVFDWFMAIPFYLGVAWWAWRLLGKARPQPDPDRDALFLFLAWAVTMLAPSVLSEAAPNYSRTLAAVPPVLLGAGLGLTWIAIRLSWRAAWRGALVAALIVASGAVTFYDYFVRFPAFPEVYYVYDADKVDAVDWMKASADEGFAVYLSPLWSSHATVTFLRDYRIRSLDATQALVLPEPGKGVIYAFPSEQRDFADDLAAIWQEPVQTLNDRLGRPLLFYVQVEADKAATWPAGFAPDQTTMARFDDAPSLIGMRASDGGSLLLHWQAEAGTRRYLTSFVHLLDARGQRVGQADVVPGNGAFPTTIWRAGERVAQRYTPALTEACSGGEPLRVLAGWYELDADGARRPRIDAPGDTAFAGTWTPPITSQPAAQIQPAFVSSAPLALSGLTLVGHTLATTTTEPGAPLTLDLFVQGDERHRSIPLTLTLESDPAAVLYTGAVASDGDWRAGEVICRRLHVRVPATTAPGDYLLHLTTPDYIQPFARVTVQPSTRSFNTPAVSQPVTATLGSAIRLHGADVAGTEGGELAVRIVWQSLAPLAMSEKVFVHLVGPDGNLIAQSDALPAGGYGTEQWVEGEVVIDEHRLMLPPDLPPGDYRLRVGMYDPATGARLSAVGSGGERLADDAVELEIGELP
jgi:4-amino-4-deoxy-L-arabinose transferase-like glycosyltransferase